MINIKGGKNQKKLESLLSDLGAASEDEAKKAKRSSKESAFMSKVCAKAAFDRVSALGCFDTFYVRESDAGESIDVTVEEPKTRWRLKVSASAPATNIRSAMCSLSGAYRNLFGTFGELSGCLAVSPHSLRDLQGEVSISRPFFLGGGRRCLSRWLTSPVPRARAYARYLARQPSSGLPLRFVNELVNRASRIFSGSHSSDREAAEESLRLERGALRSATGEPCALRLGGRVEQSDKTKESRLKKHSISAFGALSTAHYGSFGLDLTSYNILPHPRDAPSELDGIRFRPHLRCWYKAALGPAAAGAADAPLSSGKNFSANAGGASWGAALLSEAMARVPCAGARHYSDPRHGTSFVRSSVAGVVKMPAGPARVEVFGQCGAMAGLGRRCPSRAMVALEEFENNGRIVRNMSVGMIPPNMKLAAPVTAFYSVNTTVALPWPGKESGLGVMGFLDVGAVAKKMGNLFGRKGAMTRVTAGVGVRIPVAGGLIEFTLGTPLVQCKDEDDPSMFGVGSAFSP